MFRNLQDNRPIRFAICGALATALVAGCAGSGHLAKAGAHAERVHGKVHVRADRVVAKAEEAVLKSPRDVAARVALGSAYLDAGRFDSAATSFQDAIALGDHSGSTALRLALAQIGSGRGREATVILEMHRDAISAGDLGLALALAGETGTGVEILSGALRAGEDTAKLRQNLAYAFALDGRWREARLLAAQDVPADQIDARLGSWAMTSQPEAHQQRVAGLLGVPLRADEGQPVELALGSQPDAPAQPQLAVSTSASELPAVGPKLSDPSQEYVIPEPVALAAAPASALAKPASFSAAFAEAPRPMASPVRGPAPVTRSAVRQAAAKPAAGPTRGGSHAVQLGSFSSPENARRAIKMLKSRHPELKGFDLTVAPATVRGKKFWRVAAKGFSQASAVGTCSKVRTRGGACIAYSNFKPLPGMIPVRGKGGASLARR